MKAFFHYMQLAEMRSCISRSSVSSPAVAWTVWFTAGTACTGISVTIITGQAVIVTLSHVQRRMGVFMVEL